MDQERRVQGPAEIGFGITGDWVQVWSFSTLPSIWVWGYLPNLAPHGGASFLTQAPAPGIEVWTSFKVVDISTDVSLSSMAERLTSAESLTTINEVVRLIPRAGACIRKLAPPWGARRRISLHCKIEQKRRILVPAF